VAAENSLGIGDYSSLSTGSASAETVPVAPTSAPTEDGSSDDTQIVVNWASLTGTNTGGSAITDYQLVWDNGDGSFATTTVVVKTETTTFTYSSTQTTGFTLGLTYLYKYRAMNKYGWGSFSPTLTLIVGLVPD